MQGEYGQDLWVIPEVPYVRGRLKSLHEWKNEAFECKQGGWFPQILRHGGTKMSGLEWSWFALMDLSCA